MARLKAEARARVDCDNPVVRKKRRSRATDGLDQRNANRNNPNRPRPSSRVVEVSVTIFVGGDDIDAMLLGCMKSFFENECLAGLCALERGGTALHLHFQMVARLWATSLIAINKKIKAYLGWDRVAPVGGMVLCRGLKQHKMHTFEGMVGYCLKEQDEPHFRKVMHTISSVDVNKGIELYTLYGADELKNRVCLTQVNIFDRALMFWKFKLRHPIGNDFLSTVHRMVKTGKYYQSSSWITPHQGRGMEMAKIKSLWNSMIYPSCTTYEDIVSIFVANDPRANWSCSRWKERHSPSPASVENHNVDTELSDAQIGDDFVPLVHRTNVTTVA